MRRHHELHEDFHQRRGPHRGPQGHGRHRARRGALAMSVLALLDEQPMHGYELITVLEARSGGRWKPSPGAIYPALGKLEQRGLIKSTEAEGRKQYELTDEGRQVASKLREPGAKAPWDEQELGGRGELHRALAELVGPARQIGRFGTGEQNAAAVAVVKDATSRLYKILADGPAEQPGEQPAE
jgi:DNA-binding PadR family transcriptional regulator